MKKKIIYLLFFFNYIACTDTPRNPNKVLSSELHPCCISYGPYSYGFPSKIWNSAAKFSIGKFCSIATNVTIFLGENHRTDWISTYPFMAFLKEFPKAKEIIGHPATKGNIIIKNDVWIGEGTTIMSGVVIEDGAVIGANTTVAKNIPPYAIVAGNPARIIRYRFDQETIRKLIEIAWWNWSIEKINKNSHLLCSHKIDEFLEKHSK